MLNSSSTVNRNRMLLMHLSFWCVYISFFLYQISRYQKDPEIDWSRILLVVSNQLVFILIISYFNYFFLLPRFLRNRKIWMFILQFVIAFSVVMFARLHAERYLLDGYSGENGYLYNPRFIIQVVTTNFFIVAFVGLLKFVVEWLELEARKKEVENEKLTAELNFLKAQINPHFLFNTLNNLYYLAYSKSENTTEVIAKLSQMMRYMIYDSNHPKVLLTKEIEYIESYISLERLRLNNQIPIDFKVKGNVSTVLITPFILITFLENAFKHGVTNNNASAWVKISLEINGDECLYTVSNSKIPSAQIDNGGKSGIGLQNVHRRLALSYPNQYELHVDDQADTYTVKLKLIVA
ncbi:MAG TPA: histidine kinase [Chryseolinea sp.]|nr:histidine kinase [Chryseolinea sp.]